MMKEIKFLLVGIGIFALLTFPVGAVATGIAWLFNAPAIVLLLTAYFATTLAAITLHLYAKKYTSDEKIFCPECGRKNRCYECASRGGWISKAEQEALDEDEDRAGLILAKMEDK